MIAINRLARHDFLALWALRSRGNARTPDCKACPRLPEEFLSAHGVAKSNAPIVCVQIDSSVGVLENSFFAARVDHH